MGRCTAWAAARIRLVRWSPFNGSAESPRARMIRSTMTTVASTKIPKSRAPMLRRLRETPDRCMQRKANSKARGIVSAVSSAAGKLTRKTRSTVTTMTNPSTRTRDTVRSVLCTSSVLSWMGTIRTPRGRRVALISSTASWIASSTSLGFSPRRMRTIASTPPAPSGWRSIAKIPV